MASITCKYHPQDPARWHCDHCQIDFCVNCAQRPRLDALPDCPVCKRQLSSLGAGNIINPFWTRFKSFFIYPGRPSPLMLMGLLSIVFYIITFVPILGHVDFLGKQVAINEFIFFLPLVVIFLRYGQLVLDSTARGHLTPNTLNHSSLSENGSTALMMVVLVMMFSLLNHFAFDMFGMTGFYVMNVLTTFAMPASIMILSLEENNIFDALNPLVITSLIARIGWPYLAIFLLAFFITSIPNEILYYIAEYFSSDVSANFAYTVFYFFMMYCMLIVFHMMGYVLYQYHEELGISIDVEADDHVEQQQSRKQRRKSGEQKVDNPHLRAVEILIQEGKLDEAVPQLQAAIQSVPSDLDARERMLKLCRLTGDKAMHTRQGRDYINYLFHEMKYPQASDVFEACNDFDPAFKPETAVQRLEIAKHLKMNGKGKRALSLLNGMHQEFPTFEGVPQAYLMVAQLMCETFGKDDQAKQILNFILTNYSSSPLVPEVKEYLKIVDNLSNH